MIVAVAPLFSSDMASLKAGLRLSGVPTGVDAEKMIDDATESARTFFHRRLGTDRVNEILAISLVENPTTADGVLRNQARLTEIKYLKLDLMKRLRLLFIDSSSRVDQAWNTEGLLRDVSSEQAENIMRWLWNEIESDLAYLAGDEEEGVTIQATTFERDYGDCKPYPGSTAWSGRDAF